MILAPARFSLIFHFALLPLQKLNEGNLPTPTWHNQSERAILHDTQISFRQDNEHQGDLVLKKEGRLCSINLRD